MLAQVSYIEALVRHSKLCEAMTRLQDLAYTQLHMYVLRVCDRPYSGKTPVDNEYSSNSYFMSQLHFPLDICTMYIHI